MKFKFGDRVKVSTIEDVGTVSVISNETIFVIWDSKTPFEEYPYPAYQVRLAEDPTRLSRKEIRKELKKLSKEPGEISTQIVAIRNLMQYSPRKEIRKELRQLSAEAFCVDKILAERIDKIADGA